MSMSRTDLEATFERFVEHHVLHGTELPIEALCDGRPDLVQPLRALVARYHAVTRSLDTTGAQFLPGALDVAPALPAVEGFRTIERLGAGGMGEVYKLQDLKLGRIVAAKVLSAQPAVTTGVADFVREARSLALFSDPRIVGVYEVRPDANPPVILMEFVDGFELGTIGPSLDIAQRARVVKEVCEAVHRAHGLGLSHRDLKPANIMLDATLAPKILDFGLSASDPSRGHFAGTLAYIAPEQLEPAQPIDARVDVYALGVVLYELLCGRLPFTGQTELEAVAKIRAGAPPLPVEIDPRVPEPLQAIALKAMERDPAERYQSARDMALDLQRYLEGRPVLVRPSQYASALHTRVAPHIEQIAEWERLKLVYPHEAAGLRSAYRQLTRRDDDWIVESRTLSYSQIALYLGAFFLMCGSLFYFGAHRFYEAVRGLARPAAVLAVPFAGLNLAAHHLYKRDHRAVAVAFYLGAISLLPLFLLIVFHETHIWVVSEGTPGQLFTNGAVSNRQLQVTIFAAGVWTAWLALRTRTGALATVLSVVALLFTLAVLTDYGLREWFEQGRYDRFALHLAPLVAAYAVAGQIGERTRRPWLASPLFLGAALVFVTALELLALDGRAFEYLHLSMRRFQSPTVSDPLLLDTLTAMTLAGIVVYLVAWALDTYASDRKGQTAQLLFTLSPFAVLEPFAYLVKTGEYASAFDWTYLALAIVIAVLSHARQRRGFYYAGIVNTGVALWFIADHQRWFDKPAWAMVLVGVGLAALVLGFALAASERRQARPGQGQA
jgi:hypothetical protein